MKPTSIRTQVNSDRTAKTLCKDSLVCTTDIVKTQNFNQTNLVGTSTKRQAICMIGCMQGASASVLAATHRIVRLKLFSTCCFCLRRARAAHM